MLADYEIMWYAIVFAEPRAFGSLELAGSLLVTEASAMVRAPFTRHARYVRLLAFIGSGIAAVGIQAVEPAASATANSKRSETKQNTEIDVSSEVRAWNAGKYSPPSTGFRPGTVSANRASPTVVKTSHGYTIKLPSGAPIPTLTVHGGRLYASGGFHSREFYCFAADSGKLLWSVDLDDDGPTSAVFEDGVIVFNTESCTIFAVDANSGKMLWSWFLGDPLGSTPTICKGRVFTAYPATAELRQPQSVAADAKSPPDSKPSTTGPAKANAETPPPTHVLACFDLKTGKILWQRWIDSDVMSAPVAVKDELYLTSFGGVVYRFNQADGAVLSVRNARATSAPILADDNVFVTRRADDGPGKKVEEAIVKLDRRLTVERFVAARKVAPHLDVVVQANSKYAKQSLGLGASNGIGGGGFGGGGAFEVADGAGEKPKAENPPGPGEGSGTEANAVELPAGPTGAVAAVVGIDNVFSLQAFQGSRIVNSNRLNFNCMGDQVVCTDVLSGKVAWSMKLDGDLEKEGGFLAAPPAAAGGQIFLAMLKGEVLQLEPAKGTVTHRYPVGAALRFQPTIQDGRIYVGTQDGQVICIDTGDRKLTGWSTWGGNAAHTGTLTAINK